jgi:glutamine amidotransferase-like uncharacterized protein
MRQQIKEKKSFFDHFGIRSLNKQMFRQRKGWRDRTCKLVICGAADGYDQGLCAMHA